MRRRSNICRAIRRSARSPPSRERVALLWEACALPDYRSIAPAQHADLIASIYDDLVRRGHVDETYMAEQVRRADSTDGDIDTLSHRIAQIRTWTFVSNRPGLAGRSGTLAGKDARNRGQIVGCAA